MMEAHNQSSAASDAELVRQCVADNVASFEHLVTRHFGVAYAVAYARLRQREPAEELTQEAFVVAYLNIRKLRDPARFAGWVCRITRNLSLKWIRSGRKQSELLKKISCEDTAMEISTAPSAMEAIQAKQEADMLGSAIEKLAVDQREAILLHYGEELTKKETADRMGVHPATVGRLLDRALVQLRAELEPELRSATRQLRPSSQATRRAVTVISAVGAMSAGAKASLAGGAVYGTISAGSIIFSAKWSLLAAAVATGLVIAAVAAPDIIRWGFLKTRAPEERATMERFRSSPVNFPGEWTEIHNPPPAVNASVSRIAAEWNAVSQELAPLLAELPETGNFVTGTASAAATTESIIAEKTAALLDLTSATVHSPAYWMTDTLALTTYQDVAKAAVVQARVAARNGGWDRAMQTALIPAYMARRRPSEPLLVHMFATSMISRTAVCLAELNAACPDVTALQSALDNLNTVYDSVALNILDQAEIIDVLTILKSYQAAGINVSLKPGNPLAWYHEQVIEKRPEMIKYRISMLPPGSRERPELQRQLKQAEKSKNTILGPDAAYSVARVNFTEMATRELVTTARLDLARIAIAQKIRLLRGDLPATSVNELVPDFLPTEPLDPFSSSPYRLSAVADNFYSVGPNTIDETRGTEYDPTNGTLSPGDINMP